jgi:ribosomal protein S18 acetylase RimI-like enzyme
MNSDNSFAFSIRAAAMGDEGAIVALLRELAQYEKLESRFRLDESAVRRDMLGPDAAAHCAVLEADGEIAGLVTWFWIYASFSARRVLFIEDLYVAPRFRARGFGKALLKHAARRAQAGGGFLCWLVLDWNAPAIEFYRAFGAEAVAEDWTRYFVDGDALERLAAP